MQEEANKAEHAYLLLNSGSRNGAQIIVTPRYIMMKLTLVNITYPLSQSLAAAYRAMPDVADLAGLQAMLSGH
jgi:hypothetical protein